MRNLKKQQLIGCIILAYFILNGLIPRTNEVLTAKVAYLMNEGYTEAVAEHIAKVELKIIPEDAEYSEYMED